MLMRHLALFGFVAACTLGWHGCSNHTSVAEPSSQSGVLAALTASQRVMWLGAHPDDENSVSGLLARAKEVSGALYLATLTRGENENTLATHRGGQYLNPWGSPPAKRGTELGARRIQVFRTLATDLYRADAIDVGPFVNGPMSLTDLDALPPDAPYQDWVNETPDVVIAKWARDVGGNLKAPVAYVVALIRRWRPNTVISWDEWCSGSGHPEHRAVAKLLHDAVHLAADPSYPDSTQLATNAWKVDYVLAAAMIIPALVNCGYCKCQGSPPPERIENIDLHVRSTLYGAEYFDIKCRALSGYANAAQDGDLTGARTCGNPCELSSRSYPKPDGTSPAPALVLTMHRDQREFGLPHSTSCTREHRKSVRAAAETQVGRVRSSNNRLQPTLLRCAPQRG